MSSSLAWAGVGFLTGLIGYYRRRLVAPVAPPEVDEDESAAPQKKVEWLLRERKRRWRDRALVRILPVLVATASAWALAGTAAFVSLGMALALLAVGVLGLCASLVLYNQECRIEALEEQLRNRRGS